MQRELPRARSQMMRYWPLMASEVEAKARTEKSPAQLDDMAEELRVQMRRYKRAPGRKG